MKRAFGAVLCALALCMLLPGAGAEEGAVMVYPSSQQVLLNGAPTQLHAYARKDSNGYLTNYVKIRDLAKLLSGTTARFNVDWENGAVTIRSRSPYLTPNGQEDQAPYSGQQPYLPATADTVVDGERTVIDAFIIRDSGGNASTYYKLRDLGKVLDFLVTWDAEDGVLLDTSLPYRED